MKNFDYSVGKTLTTSSQEPSNFKEPVELHLGKKKLSDDTDNQVTFAFTLPQDQVIDIFEEVASINNFEMIEKEANYATAIKRGKKGSFWELMNCLSWMTPKKNLSVIKLTIYHNNKKLESGNKICRVRSLSAETPDALAFLEFFKKTLSSFEGTSLSPVLLQSSPSTEDIPQENNTNPFHMEACSYYMLHKILSTDSPAQKQIASQLNQALLDFHQAFKNVQQSSTSLPTPMNNVIGIAKETFQNIKKIIIKNNSIENSEDILPFMKIAVEKHVFDKTEKLLKNIYMEANKESNLVFDEKCKHIRQNWKVEQIFEQVLLNKNLRIAKDKNIKPCESLCAIQFCEKACAQLQRIGGTSSPREKIKNCQLMYAQLKSYFFQKLNKKYELSSMEDIIPVFIIVMLFTKIPHIRSELDMMNHFIQVASEDFEAEKRLVINLSESFNYIVRDWKIYPVS